MTHHHSPRAGLLGVPWDGSSSHRRGPARAPAAIRAALFSDASNPWSERGVDALDAAGFEDLGDLVLSESAESARAAITDAVSALARGARPLLLGGDHSITFPIMRAMRQQYPRLQVVHIDAHPDLYPDFQGDPFSHACPFARILEEGLIDRLVQVGIRTLNPIQREVAGRFGVHILPPSQWHGALPLLPGVPVYISFDLDGLDPAFAPGVSHREAGGLSVREAIAVLGRIDAPIVGADLVEYNPEADLDGVTAVVAAKLVKEFSARLQGA